MRVQVPPSVIMKRDRSIMIVDDISNLSNMLRGSLQSIDSHILNAENCYELLSQMYKYNPQILIFNANITWMNISEFALRLKETYSKPCTIFFIYDNPEKINNVRVRNKDVICIKAPFQISNLKKIIEEKLSN